MMGFGEIEMWIEGLEVCGWGGRREDMGGRGRN